MKSLNIQKVSSVVLYVLIAVTLVILGLFFFGGETPEAERLVADTSMSEPAHTNTLVVWMYVLLGVTIVVTLGAAIYKFVANFVDSPKKAIRSLLGLVVMVVLLLVTYNIGSGEPLTIPGYEGTENVPFWLKITDMFLYTTYIMMAVLIVLILGFGIAKKFK